MALGQVKPIVGGNSVEPHAYPFVAYLNIETQPNWHAVCGGTLLSTTHVVTAGHCVYHVTTPRTVKLGFGHSHIRKQEMRRARSITIHPLFNKRTLVNDIAIIKLDQPIEPNEWIHRIPVYFGPVAAGQKITTMGWGITSNLPGARTVPAMNQVDLQVADSKMCRGVDKSFKDSNGPLVCTDTQPGNRDECNGDSGSPAIITLDENEKPYKRNGITQNLDYRHWHYNQRRWMQQRKTVQTDKVQSNDVQLVALTSYGDNLQHDDHPPCGDPTGYGFSTHIAYYEEFLTNSTGLTRRQLEEPVQFDRKVMIIN
ncbi:trypsin-like serine protease [Coemansia reversa NRRL 1564]|uniref:Trypsin-like serine protease n=1 Tax=Coemansia reversa (strain ATCC 12441 / NRRL 1564) TaxID=763665 RepID=A0A2G5BJ60_COERN|nr:trypsin-like serine protease [Coemansia reversa NRRL 1564]|eukprot:PIA18787.1 trypsin-like serine protease [Coemansia reversa NRRL 1564]